MAARVRRFVRCAALGLIALTLGHRSAGQSVVTPQTLPPLPPAVSLPSDTAAVEDMVRFLEYRLQHDAAAQYRLVEQIGRLSAVNGVLYDRPLVLFYADHDLKPDEAFASATGKYAVRRDIYGADTVAWTALKAGKIAEAQSAIQEALRLETQDTRLLYHAGMIAQAVGDHAAAHHYFTRALTLNPEFDPLQARMARAALGRSQ